MTASDRPWRVVKLERKPTADGLALLHVARPSGTVVAVPLWPEDLRRLAVQAIEALEPQEDHHAR